MDSGKNIDVKMIGITCNVIVDRIGLDGYKMIANAGFDCVDFNLQRGFFSLKRNSFPDNFQDLIMKHGEKIKTCGLVISQTHAPYYTTDVYMRNEEDLEKYYEAVEQAFWATVNLGCNRFVMHPLHKLKWMNREQNEIKLTSGLIRRLSKTAHESNTLICLENLPYSFCGDVESHMAFLSNMDDSIVKGCFDMGHSLICDNNPYFHLLKMRNEIVAVHLHDNDRKHDLHDRIDLHKEYWNSVIDEIKSNEKIVSFSLETSGIYKKCREEEIFSELKKDYNCIQCAILDKNRN